MCVEFNLFREMATSGCNCVRQTVCLAVCAVICVLVMGAAGVVSVVLAAIADGFAIIGAVVVLVTLALFLIVPLIGGGIACANLTNISDKKLAVFAMVFSAAVLLFLAPFAYMTAAGLSVAEVIVGEGKDSSKVFIIALIAVVLHVAGTVASIVLCFLACLYVYWYNPSKPTRDDIKLEKQLAARRLLREKVKRTRQRAPRLMKKHRSYSVPWGL